MIRGCNDAYVGTGWAEKNLEAFIFWEILQFHWGGGLRKPPTKISTQPVSQPELEHHTHGLRNNSNHDNGSFHVHT